MLAQDGVVEDVSNQAGEAVEGTGDAAASVAESSTGFLTDLKDSIIDTDTGLVGQILDFVPRLFGFLIILFIGLFIAKLIGRGVRKLLKKINFDHYIDKSGVGAPLERAGFKDSGRFAGKVVYYLVVLFVLKSAFQVLQITALEEPFNELILWIPKAIVAMILVVVGGMVANAVRELVGAATTGQSYGEILTKVAYFGVWLIFAFAAINQLQVAKEFVDTLTKVLFSSLAGIIVIKYGVGGIWAARDHFWPAVYDSLGSGGKGQAKAPTNRTQNPTNR